MEEKKYVLGYTEYWDLKRMSTRKHLIILDYLEWLESHYIISLGIFKYKEDAERELHRFNAIVQMGVDEQKAFETFKNNLNKQQ